MSASRLLRTRRARQAGRPLGEAPPQTVAPGASPNDRIARIFLAVLVALIYGDTILYGYINDDFAMLAMTPSSALDHSLHTRLFRPVWTLSVGLLNTIGWSSLFDHALSVGLFMIASGLGYEVARRYGATPRRALLAVTAWVLLPWMVFPAVWISQRNDLLAFILTFAALLAASHTRPWWSLPLMTLGLLCKESVMLVPLFFAARFWSDRRRLALAFAAVWLADMSVLVHHSLVYTDDYAWRGDAGLSPVLRALNAVSHWIEPFFTQVVPLPFFTGIPHVLLHVAGIVLFPLSVRIASARAGARMAGLALLASFPSLITPQLRIVGFESFCLLLVLALVLSVRRPRLFAASLALLALSFVISIQATKVNFKTTNYDRGIRVLSKDVYYPNAFYQWKREALLRWLGPRGGGGSPEK